MDRPFPNKNGFTILEMLMVLLIVSVLALVTSSKPSSSLYIFMKQVQSLCICAQQKAYVNSTKIQVDMNESFWVDSMEYPIPKDIVCETDSFYYNEKGNISKANTLRCHNAKEKMKLVFQLGTGRVRLEKE